MMVPQAQEESLIKWSVCHRVEERIIGRVVQRRSKPGDRPPQTLAQALDAGIEL